MNFPYLVWVAETPNMVLEFIGCNIILLNKGLENAF